MIKRNPVIRLCSVLMAVLMLLSALPVNIFAQELSESIADDLQLAQETENQSTDDSAQQATESTQKVKSSAKSNVADVASSAELQSAIESGKKQIRIIEDFELDRTFYITGDVTIYTTQAHTLTRAANFAGDIFVVGENSKGRSAVMLGKQAKLTLGKSESQAADLLTIDGNKDNMKVAVNGSIIFMVYSSTVNLYKNVTVKNAHKSGNKRASAKAYELSSANRVGGSVVANISGTLNIYGGNYKNNSVEEYKTVDGKAVTDSIYGGAIYNNSNLSIYSGSFTDNQGAYGGVIFNNRMLEIFEGTFAKNHASSYGGVIYTANKSSAHTLIGDVLNEKNGKITFKNNTSKGDGGVIHTQTGSILVIYGNTTFEGNRSINGNGGAVCAYGQMTAKKTSFVNNSSKSRGGAIFISNNDNTVVTRIVSLTSCSFSENTAVYGGAISLYATGENYKKGGIVNATSCKFTSNEATNSGNDGCGGAIYADRKSDITAKKCTFSNNKADSEGGALSANGASKVLLNSVTATSNTTDGNGGFVSNSSSTVNVYSGTVKSNSADKKGGAFFAQGKSTLNLYNLKADGNTSDNGHIVFEDASSEKYPTVTVIGMNVAKDSKAPYFSGEKTAVLKINKTKHTDEGYSSLNSSYWSKVISSVLTVKSITSSVPPLTEEKTTSTKKPVSVEDVFSLGKKSSDADINEKYNKLKKLSNKSNFMSRNTTKFKNINGKTVSVDTFVYQTNETANNVNFGQGLLIYQALLYKKANPDEEVYIDVSSYRFSVQTAININRNSRYFGYMRSLVGKNYDQYGFVRISYLLVTAAKMGIHVNVIGQRDAYPISSKNANFYEYFTSQLNDPCDPKYVKKGVIGDYLDFNYCYWTVGNNRGGTDMMHTKLCAVSHYLDMNGKVHKNAVWTSSANLDGVKSDGANGNIKMQTATIVSDHEEIYKVSRNYLRIIGKYCYNQEKIYEFQNLFNRMTAEQVALIRAGKCDQIPDDEKVVYLGTKNDKVFEMYFTPLGGSAVEWDEIHNPYCKYLRKMYNSDDYILFTWNVAEYTGAFGLGRQIEEMITESFHKNKNPKNKIYANLEHFDYSVFDDLVTGKDIGFKSFNNLDYGILHNKDVQISYSENGKRYYVSLLNSLNFHGGSMSYQTNHILVIKERTCSENSVFSTIAQYTTKGDIVEHSYGKELTYYPKSTSKDGYTYRICSVCDKKEITGVAHRSAKWVTDRDVSFTQNGIIRKVCTICNELIETKEVLRTVNTGNLVGRTFTSASDSPVSLSTMKKVPRTIEAVVNVPEKVSGRAGVIVGNYNGGTGPQLNLEVHEKGKVRLYFYTGSKKVSCIFSKSICSDVPVHIAVTVNGKVATLYIDGVKAESKKLSKELPSATQGFKIGGDNRKGNSSYFRGTVYAVNLFSDVRTAEEIARDAIMVRREESSLLRSVYFTTENGQKTFETAILTGVKFSETKSCKIDGSLKSAPHTFEATVKVPKSVDGRAGVIVGNYKGDNSAQINLEVYTKGRIRLFFRSGEQSANCLFSKDIRSDAGPVNIAVTVNGKTATLYIDGVKAQTKKLSASLPDAVKNYVIGGDNRKGNSSYFLGTIYAVNLFSDVRTDKEIKKDAVAVTSKAASLLYSAYFTDNNKSDFAKAGLTGQSFSKSSIVTLGKNLTSTPKTIEATVRVPKSISGSAGVIVGNYNGGKGNQLNLEICSDGRVRLFFMNSGKTVDCIFSKDIRTSDGTTNIAVTVNGKSATLYVNGEKMQTRSLSAELPKITDNFRIGGDNRKGNSGYFKGTIYSVNMFSDIRTQSEIKKDRILVAGNTSGLLCSRNFVSYVCDAESQRKGHSSGKWIVNVKATSDKYGIRHKKCTVCSKILKAEEYSVNSDELYKSYTGLAGLRCASPDEIYKINKTFSSVPCTFEVTYKLSKKHSGAGGVLLGTYSGDKKNQINLEIYKNGNPRIYVKTNGKVYTYLFKTDVRSDKVSHLAVTVSGTTAKLYLNGVYKESIKMSTKLPDVRSGYCIGHDNRKKQQAYFEGTIYAVNLFSDVRSAKEIAVDKTLVTENTSKLVYSRYFTK